MSIRTKIGGIASAAADKTTQAAGFLGKSFQSGYTGLGEVTEFIGTKVDSSFIKDVGAQIQGKPTEGEIKSQQAIEQKVQTVRQAKDSALKSADQWYVNSMSPEQQVKLRDNFGGDLTKMGFDQNKIFDAYRQSVNDSYNQMPEDYKKYYNRDAFSIQNTLNYKKTKDPVGFGAWLQKPEQQSIRDYLAIEAEVKDPTKVPFSAGKLLGQVVGGVISPSAYLSTKAQLASKATTDDEKRAALKFFGNTVGVADAIIDPDKYLRGENSLTMDYLNGGGWLDLLFPAISGVKGARALWQGGDAFSLGLKGAIKSGKVGLTAIEDVIRSDDFLRSTLMKGSKFDLDTAIKGMLNNPQAGMKLLTDDKIGLAKSGLISRTLGTSVLDKYMSSSTLVGKGGRTGVLKKMATGLPLEVMGLDKGSLKFQAGMGMASVIPAVLAGSGDNIITNLAMDPLNTIISYTGLGKEHTRSKIRDEFEQTYGINPDTLGDNDPLKKSYNDAVDYMYRYTTFTEKLGWKPESNLAKFGNVIVNQALSMTTTMVGLRAGSMGWDAAVNKGLGLVTNPTTADGKLTLKSLADMEAMIKERPQDQEQIIASTRDEMIRKVKTGEFGLVDTIKLSNIVNDAVTNLESIKEQTRFFDNNARDQFATLQEELNGLMTSNDKTPEMYKLILDKTEQATKMFKDMFEARVAVVKGIDESSESFLNTINQMTNRLNIGLDVMTAVKNSSKYTHSLGKMLSKGLSPNAFAASYRMYEDTGYETFVKYAKDEVGTYRGVAEMYKVFATRQDEVTKLLEPSIHQGISRAINDRIETKMTSLGITEPATRAEYKKIVTASAYDVIYNSLFLKLGETSRKTDIVKTVDGVTKEVLEKMFGRSDTGIGVMDALIIQSNIKGMSSEQQQALFKKNGVTDNDVMAMMIASKGETAITTLVEGLMGRGVGGKFITNALVGMFGNSNIKELTSVASFILGRTRLGSVIKFANKAVKALSDIDANRPLDVVLNQLHPAIKALKDNIFNKNGITDAEIINLFSGKTEGFVDFILRLPNLTIKDISEYFKDLEANGKITLQKFLKGHIKSLLDMNRNLIGTLTDTVSSASLSNNKILNTALKALSKGSKGTVADVADTLIRNVGSVSEGDYKSVKDMMQLEQKRYMIELSGMFNSIRQLSQLHSSTLLQGQVNALRETNESMLREMMGGITKKGLLETLDNLTDTVESAEFKGKEGESQQVVAKGILVNLRNQLEGTDVLSSTDAETANKLLATVVTYYDMVGTKLIQEANVVGRFQEGIKGFVSKIDDIKARIISEAGTDFRAFVAEARKREPIIASELEALNNVFDSGSEAQGMDKPIDPTNTNIQPDSLISQGIKRLLTDETTRGFLADSYFRTTGEDVLIDPNTKVDRTTVINDAEFFITPDVVRVEADASADFNSFAIKFLEKSGIGKLFKSSNKGLNLLDTLISDDGNTDLNLRSRLAMLRHNLERKYYIYKDNMYGQTIDVNSRTFEIREGVIKTATDWIKEENPNSPDQFKFEKLSFFSENVAIGGSSDWKYVTNDDQVGQLMDKISYMQQKGVSIDRDWFLKEEFNKLHKIRLNLEGKTQMYLIPIADTSSRFIGYRKDDIKLREDVVNFVGKDIYDKNKSKDVEGRGYDNMVRAYLLLKGVGVIREGMNDSVKAKISEHLLGLWKRDGGSEGLFARFIMDVQKYQPKINSNALSVKPSDVVAAYAGAPYAGNTKALVLKDIDEVIGENKAKVQDADSWVFGKFKDHVINLTTLHNQEWMPEVLRSDIADAIKVNYNGYDGRIGKTFARAGTEQQLYVQIMSSEDNQKRFIDFVQRNTGEVVGVITSELIKNYIDNGLLKQVLMDSAVKNMFKNTADGFGVIKPIENEIDIADTRVYGLHNGPSDIFYEEVSSIHQSIQGIGGEFGDAFARGYDNYSFNVKKTEALNRLVNAFNNKDIIAAQEIIKTDFNKDISAESALTQPFKDNTTIYESSSPDVRRVVAKVISNNIIRQTIPGRTTNLAGMPLPIKVKLAAKYGQNFIVLSRRHVAEDNTNKDPTMTSVGKERRAIGDTYSTWKSGDYLIGTRFPNTSAKSYRGSKAVFIEDLVSSGVLTNVEAQYFLRNGEDAAGSVFISGYQINMFEADFDGDPLNVYAGLSKSLTTKGTESMTMGNLMGDYTDIVDKEPESQKTTDKSGFTDYDTKFDNNFKKYGIAGAWIARRMQKAQTSTASIFQRAQMMTRGKGIAGTKMSLSEFIALSNLGGLKIQAAVDGNMHGTYEDFIDMYDGIKKGMGLNTNLDYINTDYDRFIGESMLVDGSFEFLRKSVNGMAPSTMDYVGWLRGSIAGYDTTAGMSLLATLVGNIGTVMDRNLYMNLKAYVKKGFVVKRLNKIVNEGHMNHLTDEERKGFNSYLDNVRQARSPKAFDLAMRKLFGGNFNIPYHWEMKSPEENKPDRRFFTEVVDGKIISYEPSDVDFSISIVGILNSKGLRDLSRSLEGMVDSQADITLNDTTMWQNKFTKFAGNTWVSRGTEQINDTKSLIHKSVMNEKASGTDKTYAELFRGFSSGDGVNAYNTYKSKLSNGQIINKGKVKGGDYILALLKSDAYSHETKRGIVLDLLGKTGISSIPVNLFQYIVRKFPRDVAFYNSLLQTIHNDKGFANTFQDALKESKAGIKGTDIEKTGRNLLGREGWDTYLNDIISGNKDGIKQAEANIKDPSHLTKGDFQDFRSSERNLGEEGLIQLEKESTIAMIGKYKDYGSNESIIRAKQLMHKVTKPMIEEGIIMSSKDMAVNDRIPQTIYNNEVIQIFRLFNSIKDNEEVRARAWEKGLVQDIIAKLNLEIDQLNPDNPNDAEVINLVRGQGSKMLMDYFAGAWKTFVTHQGMEYLSNASTVQMMEDMTANSSERISDFKRASTDVVNNMLEILDKNSAIEMNKIVLGMNDGVRSIMLNDPLVKVQVAKAMTDIVTNNRSITPEQAYERAIARVAWATEEGQGVNYTPDTRAQIERFVQGEQAKMNKILDEHTNKTIELTKDVGDMFSNIESARSYYKDEMKNIVLKEALKNESYGERFMNGMLSIFNNTYKSSALGFAGGRFFFEGANAGMTRIVNRLSDKVASEAKFNLAMGNILGLKSGDKVMFDKSDRHVLFKEYDKLEQKQIQTFQHFDAKLQGGIINTFDRLFSATAEKIGGFTYERITKFIREGYLEDEFFTQLHRIVGSRVGPLGSNRDKAAYYKRILTGSADSLTARERMDKNALVHEATRLAVKETKEAFFDYTNNPLFISGIEKYVPFSNFAFANAKMLIKNPMGWLTAMQFLYHMDQTFSDEEYDLDEDAFKANVHVNGIGSRLLGFLGYGTFEYDIKRLSPLAFSIPRGGYPWHKLYFPTQDYDYQRLLDGELDVSRYLLKKISPMLHDVFSGDASRTMQRSMFLFSGTPIKDRTLDEIVTAYYDQDYEKLTSYSQGALDQFNNLRKKRARDASRTYEGDITTDTVKALKKFEETMGFSKEKDSNYYLRRLFPDIIANKYAIDTTKLPDDMRSAWTLSLQGVHDYLDGKPFMDDFDSDEMFTKLASLRGAFKELRSAGIYTSFIDKAEWKLTNKNALQDYFYGPSSNIFSSQNATDADYAKMLAFKYMFKNEAEHFLVSDEDKVRYGRGESIDQIVGVDKYLAMKSELIKKGVLDTPYFITSNPDAIAYDQQLTGIYREYLTKMKGEIVASTENTMSKINVERQTGNIWKLRRKQNKDAGKKGASIYAIKKYEETTKEIARLEYEYEKNNPFFYSIALMRKMRTKTSSSGPGVDLLAEMNAANKNYYNDIYGSKTSYYQAKEDYYKAADKQKGKAEAQETYNKYGYTLGELADINSMEKQAWSNSSGTSGGIGLRSMLK